MLVKTHGILFHKLKYSENSFILKVYTKEYGLVSYMLKNIRSKKINRSSLLQNLSILEIIAYHKERKDIQLINDVSLDYQYRSISQNIYKNSMVFFMNELLYKCVKEEEPNPELYEYISNSLHLLDDLTDRFADFHLIFTIHLTKYIGFFPMKNFSKDAPNIFDLKEGKFANIHPSHKDFINDPLSKKFFYILNLDMKSGELQFLNRSERSKMLDLIIQYYKIHVIGFGEMKSKSIAEAIFQ